MRMPPEFRREMLQSIFTPDRLSVIARVYLCAGCTPFEAMQKALQDIADLQVCETSEELLEKVRMMGKKHDKIMDDFERRQDEYWKMKYRQLDLYAASQQLAATISAAGVLQAATSKAVEQIIIAMRDCPCCKHHHSCCRCH
jgi:hypothetical protein